jgi:hypothetical protein
MDQLKLRAWYSHRQGLDGSLAGAKPADVLTRSGWARSLGGVGPYLTLFARAGTSREAADRAVANLEIHELPAARGCTYVLPASDFALGLAVGRSFAGAEMKVAAKLGVTEKEIDKLCDAVRKALAKNTLDPDEIRTATGNASRSLGEEGKKKGVTTTLPLALGKLQTEGEIRRVPANGRLDHQRYKYAAWRPSPLKGIKLSAEEAATALARRFYAWIGPAPLAEFQSFSGLGVKAVKAAVEPLKLEPMEPASDRMMLPEDRAKFSAFKPPKDAQYKLVSLLDPLCLRDLHAIMEPADLAREFFVEKDWRAASTLSYLPSHAILDCGRLVGLWEFDTATETIAWWPFIKKNKDLEKAVAHAEEFVREHLGDARSFSLDSPKSRAPRVDALRQAGRSGLQA